ncbi:MAG: tyrosine-type recombinase/integrase, partial [Acidobacteria bacterium]|nr:tyrosine-type recombinase/integrase [Acidobacteriota bacterium]
TRLVNLSSIQAADVFAFVRHEASRMASQSAKKVTTALRSFLSYARFSGAIERDLTGAVPTVASWSLAGFPKRLSRDEVKQVLASCNRRTIIGRRDYAVLLLLARLGLRASEVASLNLDDIDWASGTLSVRGKGGTLCKIPLPQDVGQAIATYLRKDRPRVSTRRVFLRVTAPIVGFMRPCAVGLIVKYALARAGVQSHSKGAHQFRHTLASEMLRSGASLAEIGEVLRHKNPNRTTAIYAKVDFAALRPLAPPWLGGAQ